MHRNPSTHADNSGSGDFLFFQERLLFVFLWSFGEHLLGHEALYPLLIVFKNQALNDVNMVLAPCVSGLSPPSSEGLRWGRRRGLCSCAGWSRAPPKGAEGQLQPIMIHGWSVMKSLSSSALIRKYGSQKRGKEDDGEGRQVMEREIEN